VAHIILAELSLATSDTLAIYIAKALWKGRGKHIAYVRQEHKECHNNDEQDTYR